MTSDGVENHRVKSYRGWLVTAVVLLVFMLWMLLVGYWLIALLALVLAGYCLKNWLRGEALRIDPGVLELELSPSPGALQGDVAGSLYSSGSDLQDVSELAPGALRFELRCVQVCERYRRQVAEQRKTVIWRAQQPAYIEEGSEPLRLQFQFSPPQGLPPTEPKPALQEKVWSCHHYWELVLTGVVNGVRVPAQRFRVPVYPGEARVSEPLPAAYRVSEETAAPEKTAPGPATVPDGLKARFDLHEEGGGVTLLMDPEPGRALPAALLLVGLGLVVLAGWIVSGVLVLGIGVFLLGRGVRTILAQGQATTITALFGRPLYSRHLPLSDSAQLRLAPMIPLPAEEESGYRLYAEGAGKTLTLARHLRGEDEARVLRNYLISMLGLKREDS